METTNQQTALVILLLLPLLGSLLSFITGIYSKRSAGWVATLFVALSFAVTVTLAFNLVAGISEGKLTNYEQNLFTWFFVGTTRIGFDLSFDQLTATMCLIITGIGTLIHLYSIGYMAEDESRHRFFAYLNLFVFFMLTLVLGANLLVTFIGWEGVGLCSYLLIGFWFKNKDYVAAGQKAFVMNRIGDLGFILATIVCLKIFGTIDYSEIQNHLKTIGHGTDYSSLALLLFFAATGKSAQIPLFTWLPDAMAGPTPVSALIHAATMVTAGIYLLARLHFIFELSPLCTAVIAWISVLTAFVAALIALAQTDIKKVLAYSTVSQLGFMFMAVAATAFDVALFHVLTHAFFKACLFLAAGSVIHACHHEQDMQKYGGLWKALPVTGVCYLIATLAIAGIYPFSGFFSKHLILESFSSYSNPFLVNSITYLSALATATAFITVFYMGRSFALTFLGKARSETHAHEVSAIMWIPVAILAVGSALIGLLLDHKFSIFLQPVLGAAPVDIAAAHESNVLNYIVSSLPQIAVLILSLLVFSSENLRLKVIKPIVGIFCPITMLAKGKFYVDEFYDGLIVQPFANFATLFDKVFERSGFVGIVSGIPSIAQVSSACAQYSQSGQMRWYAGCMSASAVLALVLYFNW